MAIPTTERPATTINPTANQARGTVPRDDADTDEESCKCIGFGTKVLSDKHFAGANDRGRATAVGEHFDEKGYLSRGSQHSRREHRLIW